MISALRFFLATVGIANAAVSTRKLTCRKRASASACPASKRAFQPTDMIGRVVKKAFDGCFFVGYVIEKWFDVESGVLCFRVRYEDGDIEDLDLDDLKSILTQEPCKSLESIEAILPPDESAQIPG